MVLEGGNPERPVAASAGQDNANGLFRMIFSERDQKTVDRRALTRGLLGRPDREPIALQRGDLSGCTEVDRAAFEIGALPRHGELPSIQVLEGLAQPFLVERLPVLQSQNDGLIGIKRQPGKEALDA